MDPLHQDGSAYLNDLDYHSNSPSSIQFDMSPSQSAFDNFDLSVPNHFPHTPSYNGSYQNSPFSGHSDLSFDIGEPFNFIDDHPPDHPLLEEYDPAEYDGANTSSLLMFNDNDYLTTGDNGQLSVSITPAPDHQFGVAFDHSSPSSNGGGDSGPEGELRSRASSVSSLHQHASPGLDVAQSFEAMRFESPHWAANTLPSDPTMSPQLHTKTPPQLMIPDANGQGPTFAQPPPIINAPAGDGGTRLAGPQLHIEPATPITGGAGATTPTPFRQQLHSLRQATPLNNQPQTPPQGWKFASQQMPRSDEQQLGIGQPQFGDAQLSFSYDQHSHQDGTVVGLSTTNAQIQHDDHQTSNPYLYPSQPSRMRSKSETSLLPPQWDGSSFLTSNQMLHRDSAVEDSSGTVHMNDVLSSEGDQQRRLSQSVGQGSFGHRPPQMNSNFSFGPPVSAGPFLTPEFGASIRRARSESDRHGHRQSRSEGGLLFPPNQQRNPQELLGPYLRPDELPNPNIPLHNRRASSGSPGHRRSISNASSSRASPYPSPSHSPRPQYDELPNVSMTRRLSATQADGTVLMLAPDLGAAPVVSRPNVTTGRTKHASQQRRKQEANFMCPIPGCGSTFTRSFNLKGHLRSHNEEKPFQCKWPGCGKGFARQHDCKRHEQLHSNYRPFVCDGCNKPFARMDALNRHLRSEGGAECQNLLETGRDPTKAAAAYNTPPMGPTDAPSPKHEPEALDLGAFGDLAGMSVML